MTQEETTNKEIEKFMETTNDEQVNEFVSSEKVLKIIEDIRENSPNQMFSLTFTKKNGEERNMTCRFNVKKHVKGTANPETLEKRNRTLRESGMFGVYDMQKAKENPERAYRTININTVKKIRFNGVTLEV